MPNNAQRRREGRALRRHPDQRKPSLSAPPFNPNTDIRFTYKLEIPGGLLRSEYPSTVAGTVTTRDEGDALRAALTTLADAFGFSRNVHASVGFISDALGPLGTSMRMQIARNLMTGQGLSIIEGVSFTCPICGAEQETRETYDDTGEVLTRHDVTAHDEQCDYFKASSRPEPFNWKEEPTIHINHPYKFVPVPTPQEPTEAEQQQEAAVTGEISDEQLEKVIDLSDYQRGVGDDNSGDSGRSDAGATGEEEG